MVPHSTPPGKTGRLELTDIEMNTIRDVLLDAYAKNYDREILIVLNTVIYKLEQEILSK